MSSKTSLRVTARVLKALSSQTRLKILRFLFDEGPKSYTELMNKLKLSPVRDAGKFAYHLKALLKTDLIEPDGRTKKYRLTELGRVVLGLTEELEKKAVKRRRMLVRTSKLSIEEFDRTKIVESLIKEADVPVELAQKIARETEKRLQQFRAKYLTAPLIREIVNAVLVEKGLEEYRHKLTRLGLPVYDVTNLIQRLGESKQPSEKVIIEAGRNVLEEYTLLNVLPRDIADAHISGYLHLGNIDTWILKPTEIFHDLRIFLKDGLKYAETALPKPKSFNSALNLTLHVLRLASRESMGNVLSYFNIFLAPFTRGLRREEIRNCLRNFVQELNLMPYASTTIDIELEMPFFIEDQKVQTPDEKELKYVDFVEEAQELASIFLDVLLEESSRNVILNPSSIIKVRSFPLQRETEEIFYKAHLLASRTGLPYFANIQEKANYEAVYSSSGFKLNTDWQKDWELDTLRTGCLGLVFINLPRIAYESDGKMEIFEKTLDLQLEMALRALEIKFRGICRTSQIGLFPILNYIVNGDQYFRIENVIRNVSFTGLNEAILALTGKMIYESKEALELAEKIVSRISKEAARNWRKVARAYASLSSNPEGATRFVELDIERYGWGKVKTLGGRQKPIYTDLNVVPFQAELSLTERLRIEEKFHKLCKGGHLMVIQLPNEQVEAQTLMKTTKKVLNSKIGLFSYNYNLTCCNQCGKISLGFQAKCKECGSSEKLAYFTRYNAKYSKLSKENLRLLHRPTMLKLEE